MGPGFSLQYPPRSYKRLVHIRVVSTTTHTNRTRHQPSTLHNTHYQLSCYQSHVKPDTTPPHSCSEQLHHFVNNASVRSWSRRSSTCRLHSHTKHPHAYSRNHHDPHSISYTPQPLDHHALPSIISILPGQFHPVHLPQYRHLRPHAGTHHLSGSPPPHPHIIP